MRSLEEIKAVADGAVRSTSRWLAPPLRAPFEALVASRGGIDRPPDDYARPLAQQILTLPVWAAESCAAFGATVPDDALDDAIGAAVIGYMSIRAEDDHLDEGSSGLLEAALLADALLRRAEALLAPHVGPAFWAWYDSRRAAAGRAVLAEISLQQPGTEFDEESFDRMLDRSRLIAVPAAAVYHAAGLGELVPDLEELAGHLVRAAQLIDDLRDVSLDLESGHRTHVLWRLGIDEGRGRVGTLLGLGGYSAISGDIVRALEGAIDPAERLRMPSVGEFVEAARREVSALDAEYRRGLAARLAKAVPGPARHRGD